MRLAELTATALPAGNQIAISWRPDGIPGSVGFRVIRRTGAYPDPTDPEPKVPSRGVVVADSAPGGATAEVTLLPDGRVQVLDNSLIDGTVYYYHVFAYPIDRGVRAHVEDERNKVSATATGPHGFSARMYGLLPEIYRRFDTGEQLSKFLDIIGGQFDQMYSAVRSIPDLKDVPSVDGRLLPLLAQWIGWRTDHSAGYDRQRFDIRNAVRLYQATQTLAAVQAGVRRVTGWDNVCKEFVDNVAVTNSPERHNLWLIGPSESEPGDQPLSFDEMFASRAALAATSDRLIMAYATNRSGRFEICEKERIDGAWQPSTVVVSRQGVEREPALVWRKADQKRWLFWATQRPDKGWSIEFRSRTDNGTWSAIQQFTNGTDTEPQRRSPALLVDEDDGLWVFWRELVADRWMLRYQRFKGAELNPVPDDAKTFPTDGPHEPLVESDLSVLHFVTRGGNPRILVLWARRDADRCWRVAARIKNSTRVANSDWSAITELPGATGIHDREPSAYRAKDGKLTIYFSSTRDGSWSIWNAEVDLATLEAGTPTATTKPPYSDRAPAVYDVDGKAAIVYRSGRPVTYRNLQYAATAAEDIRYCGNTTLRTGNGEQVKKMGKVDDFTAYTYDAGRAGPRTDSDLIRRDTLGIYITTPNIGQDDFLVGRRRLDEVLGEFLPATTRAVVIPNKEPI